MESVLLDKFDLIRGDNGGFDCIYEEDLSSCGFTSKSLIV